MKTSKLVVLVFTGIFVTGCGGRPGGLQDAMSYDTKSLAHVKMPDDTYRVFEHPSGDRIMTTTSIGRAAGQGLVKGITYGMADVRTPEQHHEAAARRFLDLTGRSVCQIQSGYELINTQYEFKISCPPGTMKTPMPTMQKQAETINQSAK